jgi:hypothetical protein
MQTAAIGVTLKYSDWHTAKGSFIGKPIHGEKLLMFHYFA